MTQVNGYYTLAKYKTWMASRGLSGSVGTDTSDDGIITAMIESISRYIDNETQRKFYPYIVTNYYNAESSERQMLLGDDDLLEVITLTNGDSTTLTTTDYFPQPYNGYPKWALKLKDISSKYWSPDSNSSYENAIQVNGWWGYHRDYDTRAWKSVGTLGAAISSTTATTFTATAGHSIVVDTILKIDNEIMQVSGVSTNTITVTRGDNGSTAATHDNASVIYEWQVQPEIQMAVAQILDNVYSSRTGQTGGRISVTASGVVIRPEDVPPAAQMIIKQFQRQV